MFSDWIWPQGLTFFIGLLCVTCTDLAVLAGQNYPEKWWAQQYCLREYVTEVKFSFSNYGGTPVKSEYTHEAVSYQGA